MARSGARPKRERDWRWFVAEYAVVFAGVLTALGAQQAVEALNWRSKVMEARQAIRHELADSAYAAQERVALNSCLEHRLDFLQARLNSGGDDWEGQPWSRLAGHPLADSAAYSSPIRDWNAEVWRALVADGTAAHFPREEMLRLTAIYQYIDVLRDDNTHEREQLALVAALGRHLRLPDEARAAAQFGVEDQRGINRLAAISGRQLADMIQRAGMGPAGPVWEQRMAGLRRYAADCDAGRLTPITPEGYPAPEA